MSSSATVIALRGPSLCSFLFFGFFFFTVNKVVASFLFYFSAIQHSAYSQHHSRQPLCFYFEACQAPKLRLQISKNNNSLKKTTIIVK